MTRFTHLHVASAFSAHYGTTRPERLVQAAQDAGASAAAITDRDGIYGAVRHIRACIDAGIAPIVGADLQVRNNDQLSDVTVLAHGNTKGAGWASLVRLISAAHSPRRRGHRKLHGTAHRSAWVDRNRLDGFLTVEGTPTATVLLGPHSGVGQAVLAGDRANARRLIEEWRALLAGGVAIEIVCHRTRPGSVASLKHAADMLQFATATDTPAVLTNAVRYLSPDDALTGDVLDSAANLLPLGGFQPQPNGQGWLKPTEAMHRLAYEITEYAGLRRDTAVDMLSTTEQVAERCRLDPDSDVQWRKPKVPELEVLGIGDDPTRVLAQRCEVALGERYPDVTGADLAGLRDRLQTELSTITGFGFATYFLAVADVVSLIRGMDVRVQARGSGAGSLVNYLLRVSNVDPIEHDLLFERFLGNKRSTLPDIDIDTESARRHDVYRKIFEHYGHHRTTLLSMQNTYRARGAARDAGLALGLDENQINQIAEHIWRLNARELREVLNKKPELREIAELVDADPRMDTLVDLTGRLDRLPRHISMHPCGVIVGDTNLLSITPTQPSGIGLPMSQFDKDDIDDMGLLKLDVLGVRMQSTMAYALQEIIRINGPSAAIEGGLPVDAPYVSAEGKIDLDAIPKNDETTFENIRTTHTLGMFQIESPGQRELIGKMQPDRYSDLIADISLFRPGPMKANMTVPFVERKHGYQRMNYLHPRFAPFLQDSYGVVIYHEHVLRILHETMGVSLAEADEIRRSMERDVDQIEQNVRTLTAQRLDENAQRIFTDQHIDRIWKTLRGFGSFGFCKAHGASFALPTYQSAWLKTHYPTEFMTGILEHDPGMYPRRLLMAEARRMGIPLLPLDVNVSTDSYQTERLAEGKKGIRLSLRDIKGITQAELTRITTNQPYASITDFYHRARPSRQLMRNLADLGALDSLTLVGEASAKRGGIIAYVRQLTATPSRSKTKEVPNQLSLLDDQALIGPTTPDLSPQEQMHTALVLLGAETNGHVMDLYKPMLEELGVTAAEDLLTVRNNSEVLVAGIRVATQTPPMRSGKRVVFISLDDGTGCSDCTFFENAQDKAGRLLFGAKLLIVRGRTRRTGELGISIQAEDALDLKLAWTQWNSQVPLGQTL